jgi:hypothetical protein
LDLCSGALDPRGEVGERTPVISNSSDITSAACSTAWKASSAVRAAAAIGEALGSIETGFHRDRMLSRFRATGPAGRQCSSPSGLGVAA